VAGEDFRPRQILRESGDLTLQGMEAAAGSPKDHCEAIFARRLTRQARQRLLFRVLFQFTVGVKYGNANKCLANADFCPPKRPRNDGNIVLSIRRDQIGFVTEMQVVLVETACDFLDYSLPYIHTVLIINNAKVRACPHCG
jgi:hypothetical protein